MTDDSQTVKKVKKIISEHFGIKVDKITGIESFVDDLNGDSLDLIELVMDIEDEFAITIYDDDIEKLLIVQDLIDFVVTQVDG